MITVYQKNTAGAFAEVPVTQVAPGTLSWIDLYNPTQEEEKFVEAHLGIDILTRQETETNQMLNRAYQEDGVAFMTASIIVKNDMPYPETSVVTFILAPHYLLTLRYITPTSFKNFAQLLSRSPRKFLCGSDLLEEMLEEIILRLAYNSDIVVRDLDRVSHDIYGAGAFAGGRNNPSLQLQGILKRLGACADLNSQVNESLHSLSRMLGFFRKVRSNTEEVNASIAALTSDVAALTQHAAFVSDKITFQLDAALGMINVEQNVIVKVFSMVAVFFMPPTLISSIYGMNFVHMPELHSEYGYPLALVLMLLCFLVPYIYFKRKGWL